MARISNLKPAEPTKADEPTSAPAKVVEVSRAEIISKLLALKVQPLQMVNPNDYYGYRHVSAIEATSASFVIEGRGGEVILGDSLPSTAQHARAYCNMVNTSFRHALVFLKSRLDATANPFLTQSE